ncbi:MAG: tetratricopeptide repeat protein [Bacteroidaceae bacterium]|nr:tetratricopeptide repeat protein [Bacteroidaceae bacterium]
MKRLTLIMCMVLTLCSCAGSSKRELKRAEQAMSSSAVEAGRILDSINPASLHGRQAALYGLLRTRTDYITGRNIESDSLALIATGYWGSRHKGRYNAMSWMTLGCAYSSMDKDAEAIYALLKAKELFKDTLSYDYADVNSLLGRHLLHRGLYDEAAKAFSESRIIYHNLGDCHQESFAEYNLGRVYLEKKDYRAAEEIIRRMLTDSCLDEASRNSCNLFLAHILNGMYGKEAGREELDHVNAYLAGCRSSEDLAAGYAMKGIALYYLHENDSAFIYLEKAHRLSDDLSTKIFAVKGLEWVATQMRQYQAAWNAEILNKQYQDELDALSNESEITRMRLQYNDEIQEHKFKSRISRLILYGILLIIVLIALVVIINIQRDRRREAYYIKKYDDLIQKQIEEKSNSDGNRLMEACEAFRTGIAFNLVNDVAMQRRSFKQEERDVVVHDINLYFASPIAALRAEAGKLGQQEINLIFCTLLGFDQDLTADIMCTSRSNLRSIKSRLKSKISADTFSLYFKE